jgi:capsular polysaccharide biosynthesis protein
MNKIILFLIFVVTIGLIGCATHKTLYVLDKDYLERRNIETRVFDSDNEKQIIVASAQVLQDTGFTIKESAYSLGVLTAQKNRESGSTAGKVTLAILAGLAGTTPQYEDKQIIYVNIVTVKIDKAVKVRVLFTRRTFDNYGNIMKIERIADEKIYQDFFNKLSQSVFLTAHGI